MKHKQKQRYLFAIYFGLAALAATFSLLGVLLNESAVQSLFLNLSTELFGAVLLFVILNWFFMLDSEQSLLERVERMLTILERKYSVLLGSKQSRKIFALEDRIQSAKQVDLLGYSLYRLLTEYSRRHFIESINHKGAKIRVLLINPEGMAANLISAHGAGDRYFEQCDLSFKMLTFLQKSIVPNGKGGSLDIKLINFIPSCDMIILDRDDDKKGIMKVCINEPYGWMPESKRLARRHLIFKKSNNLEDFETWLEQFELYWQYSEPWNPVNS